MGMAAENVAQKYKITKEMQDDYALLSYKRSWNAYRQGLYQPEIVEFGEMTIDESFNKERDIEKLLTRAKPIFIKEAGTVTAANSCGINDGAAAVVVMNEGLAKELT